MPINEWRGDAPAIAQVTALSCPDVNGAVEFYLGSRPLGWAREWRTSDQSDDSSLYTAELVAFWNRSRLGEFAEIAASAAVTEEGVSQLVLTARTPGRPFTVTTSIGGTTTANEIQIVTVHKATGGTTVLTFDGQSTTALAITASAATVLAALEALSNIAPGDVTVELLAVGSWKITFAGDYAGTNVPVLLATSGSLTGGDCLVEVTRLVTGISPINNVQAVLLPGGPTGGTFTLQLPGFSVSGAIAYNASAGTVQSALEAVLGVGNVTCSGGSLPATAVAVTFADELGGISQPLLIGDGTNLTGGTSLLAVATTTTGVAGTNSVFRYTLSSNPATADSGGRTAFKFRIRIHPPSYSTTYYWQTAELSYTATAAQVQAALEAMLYCHNHTPGAVASGGLPFAGSGVTVTGSLEGSWTSGYLQIEFSGLWHSVAVQLDLSDTFGTLATQGDFYYDYRPTNNHNVAYVRTVVTAGAAGTNEVQTLTQTGSDPGSFRLTFGGQTTDLIPYGSAKEVVGRALARLSTIGQLGADSLNPTAHVVASSPNPSANSLSYHQNVLAWGGPLGTAPVTLTFRSGGLQSTNVAEIGVIEARNLVQVDTTTEGVPGTPEQQRVELTGSPWGGTFPLSFSGQTTGAISYAAGSATLQAALEALSNISPGDLAVTGEAPLWTVFFSGALGPVALLSGVGTALKNGSVDVITQRDGGTQVTQATSQRSRGPWHGDDPFNWTLGHAPQRGETPVFQFGATGPRWGITWRASFTRDAVDTSLLNCSGDLADGQVVEVRSTTTLPTGLAAATAYYIRDFDPDAGTLRLAASLGGAAIAISGGSGTHEVFVPLAGLKTFATWRGWIGNTVNDANGKFREYRPIYLQCGWAANARVTLGEGQGSASPLVRCDFADFPVRCEVLNTSGSAESDLPSVLLLCNHATTTLEVLNGDAGVALLAGETSQLLSLIVRDGEAQLGEGVTFASGGSIDVTGGQLVSLATLAGVLKIRS